MAQSSFTLTDLYREYSEFVQSEPRRQQEIINLWCDRGLLTWGSVDCFEETRAFMTGAIQEAEEHIKEFAL